MKKAIVAVPYLSGKGGTETVIKNFYDALTEYSDDQEWSWNLVSFGGTKYSSWMDKWPKKVYSFSDNRVIQLGCYASIMPFLIRSILKKEQPDTFIATNPIIWTLAYKFKKKLSPKTKIIAWYHYSFKMKNVKSKYLKNVDRFWAISNGIRKELISMGVPSNKIDLIYNPVPTKNVNLISRSGLQNHFIYIGRIDYDGQKNVSELIKAFNQIKDMNWKCDLYGNVDEETKKRLLKLATENTTRNISFKGFYTDVWSHIKEADAILLTSKYEGFGMVLCEAAERGVSLISSNCPMGPEEIINSKNGILYGSKNYIELSNIIKDYISEQKKLPASKQVSESVQKFGYQSFYKKIMSCLKEI